MSINYYFLWYIIKLNMSDIRDINVNKLSKQILKPEEGLKDLNPERTEIKNNSREEFINELFDVYKSNKKIPKHEEVDYKIIPIGRWHLINITLLASSLLTCAAAMML